MNSFYCVLIFAKPQTDFIFFFHEPKVISKNIESYKKKRERENTAFSALLEIRGFALQCNLRQELEIYEDQVFPLNSKVFSLEMGSASGS